MARKTADDGVVVIKKYANRRLYNTATSSYVTLEDLCRMVQDGVEFQVHDAKTGQDLTRSVLTQIIVEEEQKGQNLLPIGFLRQLIGMYRDSMCWMLPHYLENMMAWYARNQDRMRQQMTPPLGSVVPTSMEEMQRQNMALFEQTMRMFNPLAAMQPNGREPPKATPDEPPPPPDDDATLDELRDQLAAMQRRLNDLAARRSGKEDGDG